MEKRKITLRWLKNHMTYSWWKYVTLIACCAFGISLIFDVTEYKPPESAKIEFYACNGYFDTAAAEEQLWPQFIERCPDQEELTVLNIDLKGQDMYAPMQFTTYMAAQQGDVLLLPVEEVAELVEDGVDYAFANLQPYVDSGVLDLRGIDASVGILTATNGETGLYAIPADSLTGLSRFYCNPSGSMLVVTSYSGNEENAARFIDMLIELCTIK